MTARTRQQQERYESARVDRVERAKQRLRDLYVVVQCEVEGFSVSATARRLCVSRKTAVWLRVCVGLSTCGEVPSVLDWRARGARKP